MVRTPPQTSDGHLKKPSKTREELEAAIRLEMEDICEWPTGLAISVVPREELLESRDHDGRAARCGSVRHDRNDCRQAAHSVRLEGLTTQGKARALRGPASRESHQSTSNPTPHNAVTRIHVAILGERRTPVSGHRFQFDVGRHAAARQSGIAKPTLIQWLRDQVPERLVALAARVRSPPSTAKISL